MAEFVIYDNDTGIVHRSQFIADDLTAAQLEWDHNAGVTVIAHTGAVDQHTEYVSGGVVVARPAAASSIDKVAITADNTDKATISNLPIDTQVYVYDATGKSVYVLESVDDLEIKAASAQTIEVHVNEPLPAIQVVHTIEAT